jgi:hypothetical protein
MNCRGVVVAGVLWALSATTVAADVKAEWVTGFDFGGDDLLKVTYVGGDTGTIKAGNGFYAKGGFSMPIGMSDNLELVGLIGWKYASVTGSNGDAKLERFPLDIDVRYTMDKHRFTAGVTKDLSIDFSGSGVLSGVGTTLDSQLGFALQYEYVLDNGLGVGGRYTSLKYDAPDYNDTVDAGSFGLMLSGSF